MSRALALAAKGVGLVSPGRWWLCNCQSQGRIVGEGFYVYEQLKHAETYALEQAGVRAKGAQAMFRWSLIRITAARLLALMP